MSNPPARRIQLDVLTRRYWACFLGDPGTVALMLLQAPLIGWMCTLVWGAMGSDSASLYFVLSLSAVWFGCINACREIVKERAIVERERLLGLSIPAYIGSKLKVLAGLGLAQSVLLVLAVEWSISMRGPMLLQIGALWLATMGGTGLGLAISAMSSSQERAVGAIPLLILPQILFSEFSIPAERFDRVVEVAEKLMPAHWCYEVFSQAAATETEWGQVALAIGASILMAGGLAGLAILALLPRREVL